MYTGWKSVHGLKIQTFNLMNGMTAHCSDVYSCREPDSIVLQESGLENLFSRVQLRSPIQYLIWGDSAYQDTLLQHIFSFKSLPMASMRESIEQDYGELKTNWSFLDHKKGLKVLLNRVGHEILCALIMHNAFLTLNNGKTAATYGIATPTVLWRSGFLRAQEEDNLMFDFYKFCLVNVAIVCIKTMNVFHCIFGD